MAAPLVAVWPRPPLRYGSGWTDAARGGRGSDGPGLDRRWWSMIVLVGAAAACLGALLTGWIARAAVSSADPLADTGASMPLGEVPGALQVAVARALEGEASGWSAAVAARSEG